MYQFCLDFKIRQPNIYYETGEENSGAYKTLGTMSDYELWSWLKNWGVFIALTVATV